MLSLLADHNFNFNVVRAVRRRAADGGLALDLVTAQEAGLERADDIALLEWAAREGRAVLTGDVNTLIGYAKQRIEAGLAMPGVFAVRYDAPLVQVIEDVLLIGIAGEPREYEHVIEYLPL